MNFKDEALALRARGFFAFPVHSIRPNWNGQVRCTCGKTDCKSVGKHPMIENWRDSAKQASDEDVEVWTKQYPTANIGIITDGLVVVDIDDAESPLAQEILPLLPATLSARTGRDGGMHRLYTASREHTLTVHAFGGLDIRAKGGFIVAPPSRHASGNFYEWINPTMAITVLPDEVLTRLEQQVRVRKSVHVGTTDDSSVVPEGQRHDWLRREIFSRVVGKHMPRGELEAVVDSFLLTQVANAEDISPAEINALITGAYEKKSDFVLTDLTEVGAAEKFVAYWKDDLVKLNSGEWFRHVDGLWEPLSEPEVLFKPVREVILSVNASGDIDDEVKKAYKKFHKASGSWRFAEAVVRFAAHDLTAQVSDFTPPDDTLPLGMVFSIWSPGTSGPSRRLTISWEPWGVPTTPRRIVRSGKTPSPL